MFTIKAGTSPAKMANGDIIVDMGQVLRNLSGVEQDKEKKSLMQQILEPKEVDDSSRDTKKALQIARKIARGEPVTPQEKDFLMRVDPKLAQMAQLAKQQGDRVKHALESASSKEEQQTVIMQAYQQVTEFTKANPQFGMLVGEAVKAAIQKAQKSASKESQSEQPATSLPAQASQDASAPTEPEGRGSIDPGAPQSATFSETEDAFLSQPAKQSPQDALMDQFFPEEWVSMLNCQS